MRDWPPYFADGCWDGGSVRRRQEELAAVHSSWPLRQIDLLTEPLPESFVLQYEETFGITLPIEYRSFLLTVGDGGYGPGLGLRHLGQPLDDSAPWTPGTIASDPETTPDTRLAQSFEHVSPVPADNMEHPVGGLLYLFDFGDALWDVLVVNGPSRGEVWSDLIVDGIGIVPIELVSSTGTAGPRHPGADEMGDRLSFSDYYGLWLTTGSAR